MSPRRSPHQLAKYIAYILERRPDEFGLVPDPQGYLKLKEFLKALREEPGFAAVRQGDLEEIRITLPAPPFELLGDRIRGCDRTLLPNRTRPEHLPKLLYTCVRRRAYPHVHDQGIRPMGRGNIVLAVDLEMARRMGRRIDREPVLLTVMAQAASRASIDFQQAGAGLLLASFIPPDCFSGPPPPKELDTPGPKPKAQAASPPAPGAFAMDPDRFAAAVSGGRKKGPVLPGTAAPPSLKGRKGERKRKRKREKPPWRQ